MPPRKRTQEGPVRASIYVRMSLDKSGEGLGVERQEKACRDFCQDRGWQVREVHKDNDVSATKGKRRPAFEALLESSPEVIVVWHTDRLVRLTRDLERVIDLGVNVHAVTAGHLDLSNPAGRAVARTVTAWATYEGEQKGERQRASARQRADAGKAWWSSRPFGFEMDGSLRETEAEALRKAYADLLAGASLPSLARALNEAGHQTIRGNAWTATTLRPVLLNTRNAGLRAYEGEIVGEAAWEAIVPEETFRAAQRLLMNPARKTGGGGAAPRNMLTGIATCGVCGGGIKVGWRGGRKGEEGAYAVYVCRVRSCVSHQVEFTDSVVLHKVIALLQRPEYHRAWSGPTGDAEEAAALRAEEAALRQRLNDITDDYMAGTLTRAQLQNGTARARARLEEIEAEMARIGSDAGLARILGDIEYVWQELGSMTTAQRRAVIQATLRSITLLPRGRGAGLSRAAIQMVGRYEPEPSPPEVPRLTPTPSL